MLMIPFLSPDLMLADNDNDNNNNNDNNNDDDNDTNINHKGLQRTANEYAEERRIYKDLISKNEK